MCSKFTVGMNIHRWGAPFFSYEKEMLGENISLCKELGVKCIRFNNSCMDEQCISNALAAATEVKNSGMSVMHVIDDSSWKATENISDLSQLEKHFEMKMKNVAKILKGQVDIYQVFNEMDVAAMHGDIANIILPMHDGKEIGEYDSNLFERAIVSVRGALKGIKTGDPNAKTCVNFAWWHTALIYEMYRAGCRWDFTGIDWYSDCEEVSSIDLLIADIKKNIPESDLIICETNYWMHPMSRDPIEKQEALKVKEKRFAGQENWVPDFMDKLIRLNEPKLKSVIFYELLDEPVYERRSGCYNGESHFGFVECDENGKNRIKKPAFYSLQNKIKDLGL